MAKIVNSTFVSLDGVVNHMEKPDELHLWVHPVFAGVGDENDVLFEDGLHARLETSNVQALDNGVVVLSFRKPQ